MGTLNLPVSKTWKYRALISVFASLAFSGPLIAQDLPSWVQAVPTHNWTPSLGGGIWYQAAHVVAGIAPALDSFPQPVLVGLRGGIHEDGYRFDLNQWDTADPDYNWYSPSDHCNQERVLQTLESHNAEFIWSMPVPVNLTATPYSGGYWSTGEGYLHQTPAYYAAYLQYLTEPVTPGFNYASLNVATNFFTDATCTTISTANDEALDHNWGNLRARRGHVAPYSLKSVILGVEPYTSANENFDPTDGAGYGTQVNLYRNAIRARGGALTTIPLGLCCHGYWPSDNTADKSSCDSTSWTCWFEPMMNKASHSTAGAGQPTSSLLDFSYLDMHHAYWYPNWGNDELYRVYPTLRHTAGLFTDYWTGAVPQTDCSRALWWYGDAFASLHDYGDDTNRWHIGCAEHGLAGSTPNGVSNDMGAGLGWSLWLAELMRYNADWDMNWVLCSSGSSAAQFQYMPSVYDPETNCLTWTPGAYAYKMAQEFYGYQFLDNSYVSPTSVSGTTPSGEYLYEDATYTSPDVEVRVFRNPADDHYHLFIVNKNTTTSATITDWEDWNVVSWEQLTASSEIASNELGTADNHIHNQNVTPPAEGNPLVIPKISVNHIELARNPNLLSQTLVNVQFGGTPDVYPNSFPQSYKIGSEATGFFTSDFWNYGYQSDSDSGDFEIDGAWDCGASSTGINIQVGDEYSDEIVSDTWGESSDPLFEGGLITGGGGDMRFILDLPAGTYDIYVYCVAPSSWGGDAGLVTFTLTHDGTQIGSATGGNGGASHVEFANVSLAYGGSLYIDGNAGEIGPYCNGLQILKH